MESQQQAPAQQQQQLRSHQSLKESYVQFFNNSERHVNLFWIDYKGRRKFYFLLRPRASIKVNTFCSHPWSFCDKLTGEALHVAHQNIFWPEPYRMPDPTNLSQWISCRKQINIHFPVRTLRTTSLWRVLTLLRAAKRKKDISMNATIDNDMCIPLTLKTDLKDLQCLIEAHEKR